MAAFGVPLTTAGSALLAVVAPREGALSLYDVQESRPVRHARVPVLTRLQRDDVDDCSLSSLAATLRKRSTRLALPPDASAGVALGGGVLLVCGASGVAHVSLDSLAVLAHRALDAKKADDDDDDDDDGHRRRRVVCRAGGWSNCTGRLVRHRHRHEHGLHAAELVEFAGRYPACDDFARWTDGAGAFVALLDTRRRQIRAFAIDEAAHALAPGPWNVDLSHAGVVPALAPLDGGAALGVILGGTGCVFGARGPHRAAQPTAQLLARADGPVLSADGTVRWHVPAPDGVACADNEDEEEEEEEEEEEGVALLEEWPAAAEDLLCVLSPALVLEVSMQGRVLARQPLGGGDLMPSPFEFHLAAAEGSAFAAQAFELEQHVQVEAASPPALLWTGDTLHFVFAHEGETRALAARGARFEAAPAVADTLLAARGRVRVFSTRVEYAGGAGATLPFTADKASCVGAADGGAGAAVVAARGRSVCVLVWDGGWLEALVLGPRSEEVTAVEAVSVCERDGVVLAVAEWHSRSVELVRADPRRGFFRPVARVQPAFARGVHCRVLVHVGGVLLCGTPDGCVAAVPIARLVEEAREAVDVAVAGIVRCPFSIHRLSEREVLLCALHGPGQLVLGSVGEDHAVAWTPVVGRPVPLVAAPASLAPVDARSFLYVERGSGELRWAEIADAAGPVRFAHSLADVAGSLRGAYTVVHSVTRVGAMGAVVALTDVVGRATCLCACADGTQALVELKDAAPSLLSAGAGRVALVDCAHGVRAFTLPGLTPLWAACFSSAVGGAAWVVGDGGGLVVLEGADVCVLGADGEERARWRHPEGAALIDVVCADATCAEDSVRTLHAACVLSACARVTVLGIATPRKGAPARVEAVASFDARAVVRVSQPLLLRLATFCVEQPGGRDAEGWARLTLCDGDARGAIRVTTALPRTQAKHQVVV